MIIKSTHENYLTDIPISQKTLRKFLDKSGISTYDQYVERRASKKRLNTHRLPWRMKMNQLAIRKYLHRLESPQDKRQHETVASPFFLRELDRSAIIDNMLIDKKYLCEEIRSAGDMREICPECKDVHLQLVLRQKNVRLAHLFCGKCFRCFDACYPDGCSALSLA